jgi:ribonuclease E/ribonuclease G
MSKDRELMVDERHGRLVAAVVRKNGLSDLYVDGPDSIAAWGSIYLGRVAKIDRALDAAIMELGDGLQGILPAKHAQPVAANAGTRKLPIGDVLRPGQSILVQVKSEAKRGSRHEQAKLPRLTSKIVLMGQYVHHTPLSGAVLMSRKIARGDIIETVGQMKSGTVGCLVQATADLARPEEPPAEAAVLARKWEEIKADMQGGGDQPRLLLAGPNAMERALIDYSSAGFDHIHVADRNILKLMQDWCAVYQPDLASSKRLRLFKPEKLGQKLFDIYDVEGSIEDLQDAQVPLLGGGGIIIDYTLAMVVIDVNQGSCPSILDANLEAAREVARQMRLRNLSGAILVDFINMSQRSERELLIATLQKALADDCCGALVHGFTRIGIAEITRKRRAAMHVERQIEAQAPAGLAFNKKA